MKKVSLIYIFIFMFILEVFATATTYYVDYAGYGASNGLAWETRASVSQFESNNFSYASGDIVCFGDDFDMDTNNAGEIRIPFTAGTSDLVRIKFDGSAAGDCAGVAAGGGSQARIYIDQDNLSGFHVYDQDINYITINGFKIYSRSTPTNADYFGIRLQCYTANAPCVGVDITNNELEIYGFNNSGNRTRGIRLHGAFQDSKIQDNSIIGKNMGAYDGLTLTTQTRVGAISNIDVSGNTISDWGHNGMNVQPAETSGYVTTVTGIDIYNNVFSFTNRAYGRALSLWCSESGYADDVIQNVYVHDNIFRDQRAPIQLGRVKNFSFYRNIFENSRNVCGPATPTDYDAAMSGEPAYMGDTDCQEDCYLGNCSESQSWGNSNGWFTGQNFVNLYQLTDGAFFQNTFDETAEGNFQFRGNVDNVDIIGNIFSRYSLYSVGSWTSVDNTNCIVENNPYPWCLGGCYDGYCYTYDSPQGGDTNPPGSNLTTTDCSIYNNDDFTIADGFTDCNLENNIFYGSPISEELCGPDGKIERATAEGTGGYGAGDGLYAANNSELNPLLSSPSSGNFNLEAGSPAIDRGFWAFVDGNSADDAFVVHAGQALFLGAPGETIKTAAGATGVILSINYATNTITTVAAINVIDDEGIGLDYKGLSLDAGAIEYDDEYDYSIGRITVGTNQITVGTNQIEIVE